MGGDQPQPAGVRTRFQRECVSGMGKEAGIRAAPWGQGKWCREGPRAARDPPTGPMTPCQAQVSSQPVSKRGTVSSSGTAVAVKGDHLSEVDSAREQPRSSRYPPGPPGTRGSAWPQPRGLPVPKPTHVHLFVNKYLLSFHLALN